MPTDMSEKGLEEIIVNYLVEHNGFERTRTDGDIPDYEPAYAMDTARLFAFLMATQPEEFAKLNISAANNRKNFLERVSKDITNRGVIDVLRNGVKCYPVNNLVMFCQTPSAKNAAAQEKFSKNIWSVARQVHYSAKDTALSVDIVVFVNGLPIMTFELKNRRTGQNAADAVEQYRKTRNPKELLFSFKRCMAHFALDDERAMFCARLDGTKSVFLPFNKGREDGSAGNPVNAGGIMTDYIWREILTKEKLARIIEHYASTVKQTDPDTKREISKQIFPRYHQLDAVEKLLADVRANGVGGKYLIQHSAGSGKSNSIAWLALQLMGLEDADGNTMIDTVLVLTDRRILDKQTRNTITGFAQMGHIVKWAEHSGDLKKFITDGSRIIVSTIEKFPYVGGMEGAGRGKRFAIIIDEAHSGQTGRNSGWMQRTLRDMSLPEDADEEDIIASWAAGRRLLENASYFAFTATPKNKTLETFGTPDGIGEDGKPRFRPFHNYTMKQAIQEGFILDVLANYTPIKSYFRLIKTVEDEPEFDREKSLRKLKAFVERQTYTIEQKAEMMIDHLHEQVIAKGKIGGQARAMLVTDSIESCIEYYHAINKFLEARKSAYKAIIAFSGEHERGGKKVTSEGLNGFPDKEITTRIKHDPYRLLIVADMFQTGYDEPLLHTMYVDKMLFDIKAVQTLSRLNRSCPRKTDTFVLDFRNEPEAIAEAFSRYYRTTILSGETDPNKLNDLISVMEEQHVCTADDIDRAAKMYASDEPREMIDPITDAAAERYKALETDGQIKFKSAAKNFARTYAFLGSILPYPNAEWEKLSIFLWLLLPKLPSPKGEDLTDGLIDSVDYDSYRIEAQAKMSLLLADNDAEIDPVPAGSATGEITPDMEELSAILTDFHKTFGDIGWTDSDRIKRIANELPAMALKNEQYRNAVENSTDPDNIRAAFDSIFHGVINKVTQDSVEFMKQCYDNPSFYKMLATAVFNASRGGKPMPIFPTLPALGIQSAEQVRKNHISA